MLLGAPAVSARLADLAGQVRATGAATIHQLDGADAAADLRAVAAIMRSAGEPLLLCTADLVANDSVLLILATEPGDRTYALTSAVPGAVREERGRVTAVGGHGEGPGAGAVRAGGSFLGALRIAEGDLAAAAECCERAAAKASSSPAAKAGSGTAARAGDGAAAKAGSGTAAQLASGASAVDLLLRELVESGVPVMSSRVRLLHAERVTDADALPSALARVAAVDEDRARLRYAVKERDDFFTTYFVSPYSMYLARWAARRGLSPATVTAASVVLAALAAGAFAVASRPAMVAGALLLYAGFVLDCVDGQLARYTRRFSAFGAWLDTMADRAKEYAVYAGLAAGAGGGRAWWLAIAAMALQTVRHMTDTWYGWLHDEAVARRAGAPAGRDDRGGMLGRVSDRVLADAGSVAYWLKRIVVFPIGERWATIALTAAVFDGRVALTVVLVWGGLAAAYTLSLRSLRSLRMRVPVMTTVDIPDQRDDGPLVRYLLSRVGLPAPLAAATLAVLAAAGLVLVRGDWYWAAALVVLGAGLPGRAGHTGALDWLVPAALRAAEYLFVIGVGIAGEVPRPLTFALLAALALHHYDITARPTGKPHVAALGWDGRVVLLAVATAASAAVGVVGVLAVYLWLVFGVRAVATWFPRGWPPPRPGGQQAGVHSRAQTGGT